MYCFGVQLHRQAVGRAGGNLLSVLYLSKYFNKASLTSHRTCTYVLVTEKNQLICKGPSRHTCDFRTESQGHTDPSVENDMHIFSVCIQHVS